MRQACFNHGFTLIELSIVLVIIGLIVGGILVGQDMVNAAEARATISQIEKYQTATNTFRTKFVYLPGDIPDPAATGFGLQARGLYAGEGDGNGVIEGILSNAPASDEGIREGAGETILFWQDLSTMRLIDGSFTFATASTNPVSGITPNSAAPIANVRSYFPAAKLGGGNYVYVYSSGHPAKGPNYFGIAVFSSVDGAGGFYSTPGVSVKQAFQIDTKIDDGMPQSGSVTAQYANTSVTYGALSWAGTIGTGATTASTSTCYDNGGVTGQQHYSMSQASGAGANCGLSFRFQ